VEWINASHNLQETADRYSEMFSKGPSVKIGEDPI
jgi:hypothetical protein